MYRLNVSKYQFTVSVPYKSQDRCIQFARDFATQHSFTILLEELNPLTGRWRVVCKVEPIKKPEYV